MESLIIGVAAGVIASGIILLVEMLLRRRERKREIADERLVKFTNEERRITSSIFSFLGPRSSIELMKAELGPPNKKLKESGGLFTSTTPRQTNSYIYYFRNCEVKITSKDNETIDSLTVLAHDTDIAFSNLFFVDPDGKDEFLNVATLTPEMLEHCEAEEFLGCMDVFYAAQKMIGNPFFVYLTYFCNYEGGGDIAKNPNLLAGSVIHGICLATDSDVPSYPFHEVPC